MEGIVCHIYHLYGITEEELDFIIRSALPLLKTHCVRARLVETLQT